MQDLAKRLEKARVAKQAALEEQRSAREMQELAECTFRPTVMPRPIPVSKVTTHPYIATLPAKTYMPTYVKVISATSKKLISTL